MPNNNAFSNVDQDALNLTRAIGLTESGQNGKPNYNATGASGEQGAYQWMPGNFQAAAKAAGLNPSDFSPENQDKVAYAEVKKYKDEGYQPWQIASLWNSGSPDNWQNHSGTNSHGVHYDTPAYVSKVKNNYMALSGNGSPALQDVNVPSPQLGQSNTFLGDVGNSLTTAGTRLSNAIGQTASGQINPLSGIIQGAGAIAGGVGDLTNNVLEHTPVVGTVYKGLEGLIGKGVGALAQTNAGQGLINNYQQFAQAHPELAGDIGNAVDIASVIPVLKGVGIAKEAAGAGIRGVLKGSAEKAAAEALDTDAPKLLDVKAGIKQGLISTGKNGPVLGADSAKQLSAKYVADEMKSGALSKTASPTEIAVHSENAADNEAMNLENMLSSSEVQNIVQPEDLQNLYIKTLERAGSSATSGENPAQVLLKVFSDNLPKGRDILPVDVLKARRAVGNFIRENRGDWSQRGVLTGFKSARNAFWDESRNLLAKLAPDVPVIPSLEKQSALYRVADYLAPKVKKEIIAAANSTFMHRHPVIRGLVRVGTKAAIEGTGIGATMRILQ